MAEELDKLVSDADYGARDFLRDCVAHWRTGDLDHKRLVMPALTKAFIREPKEAESTCTTFLIAGLEDGLQRLGIVHTSNTAQVEGSDAPALPERSNDEPEPTT